MMHNELKFLSLSGSHSLEAANSPGMAKVLSSNLTRTCFFFQMGNSPFQQNSRFINCLMFCRLLHLKIFCCMKFSLYLLSIFTPAFLILLALTSYIVFFSDEMISVYILSAY